MSRRLTWAEEQLINKMSARNPQGAIRLSRLLEENSYHSHGRTYYFETPKDDKGEENDEG